MKKKLELLKFGKNYIGIYNGSTLRSWHTFLGALERFDKYRSKPSDNTFSHADYIEFKNFLLQDGYSNNSIVTFTDKLKAMLRAAGRTGYALSKDMHLMSHKSDESQAVFITTDEVVRMARKSMPDNLSLIRDYFVIGCFTGLRFSDYSRISRENIVGNNIEVLHKKTNTKTIVPIHPVLKEIFKKHNGVLPACPSAAYCNLKLPMIAAMAGINEKVRLEREVNGVNQISVHLKHELVRTHTARRSAATNMYLSGIPVYRIMMITGHQTEQNFFKYIRIRKEENADELSKSPFFTGK